MEIIKNNQILELLNTMNKIKNAQNKEKRMKKTEETLCDLWDITKRPICELLEFQQKNREKEVECIFKEIMAETSQIWELFGYSNS